MIFVKTFVWIIKVQIPLKKYLTLIPQHYSLTLFISA